VLIVVGAYFLLRNLGLLDWLRSDIFWPLVIIALGVWLIVRRGWR
jgi:LiaI-LiaF-like transmembrane region